MATNGTEELRAKTTALYIWSSGVH